MRIYAVCFDVFRVVVLEFKAPPAVACYSYNFYLVKPLEPCWEFIISIFGSEDWRGSGAVSILSRFDMDCGRVDFRVRELTLNI